MMIYDKKHSFCVIHFNIDNQHQDNYEAEMMYSRKSHFGLLKVLLLRLVWHKIIRLRHAGDIVVITSKACNI